MRRLMTALRRAIALYQVRTLEITLDGQHQALQSIRCRDTRACIEAARRITERELATARAKYIALLPVGERRTWGMA